MKERANKQIWAIRFLNSLIVKLPLPIPQIPPPPPPGGLAFPPVTTSSTSPSSAARPPSQPPTPSSQQSGGGSGSPVQNNFTSQQNWSFEEQFKQVSERPIPMRPIGHRVRADGRFHLFGGTKKDRVAAGGVKPLPACMSVLPPYYPHQFSRPFLLRAARIVNLPLSLTRPPFLPVSMKEQERGRRMERAGAINEVVKLNLAVFARAASISLSLSLSLLARLSAAPSLSPTVINSLSPPLSLLFPRYRTT